MLDPIKDIIRLTGLSDPALHALIGLAIFMPASAILRKPLRSWPPWLFALGAQMLNELADVARDVFDGEHISWRGSMIDTVFTMAVPTLMLVLSRWLHRR